ncbi:MAG: hypothetical protein KatS3mg043_0498 [Rhodothermaceae bacterium]|nr:MAG: hypothetical protein KatS3mg043_0498 [Rhodothermaceae bacterium]
MYRTSLLLFVLLFPWLPGCGEARQTPLLTVAGEPVSAETFRTAYVDYLLQTGLKDDARLRDGFLQRLITTKLVVREARDAGIEQEEGFRFFREKARRKLLVEAFADRVLFDTIRVTEAELAEVFVRMNTQLRARHLYAPTRETAEALYARLQAGESFETLAREVFADTTLARNGGDLGYFSFDEMDPAFEEAAFALRPGEISAPVRTAYGYSIIRVEDRFTKPILTETEFAAKKDRLEAYVLRRKRAQARSAYVRHAAEALAVTFHEPAFSHLVDQAAGRAGITDDETAAAFLEAPLVSFGPSDSRRTWTVADFRERARFTGAARRAAIDTRAEMEDFVRGLAVQEAMIEQAEAAGLDDLPEFREALRRALDEWIWEQAFTRIVAGTVVPEDTLRAHYEAYRDAFVVPERVRVREILVATKAEAESLRARLGRTRFEDLARRYSLRPGADATGGDLGYVTRDQLGVLGPKVFEAAPGAVLGPIEVKGRYVLLEIGDRQPARPAPFEEARAEIERQLREHFEMKRFREHADRLRTRYDVQVHREAAARLAAALDAKKTS